MTDFKRRTLFLLTGKQIKLYGNSIAIGSSLEIGEGAAPNIFSFIEQQPEEKTDAETPVVVQDGKPSKEKTAKKSSAAIHNPHKLTVMDILEIADYNIRLWSNLKDNIRKYGVSNPKIFNREY